VTPRGDEHDDLVCQIVRGTAEADVVLRTDDVVAFLDIHPVFKGHVLVSPVRHVDTLLELAADQMVPLLTATQRVARAVSTALGAQGTFVAVNNVVSQSVPHLHVHVVPRTRGDGLRGFFWPRQRYAEGEQLAYATLLREALEADDAP
jgi:histidine triad (HIT) family protein